MIDKIEYTLNCACCGEAFSSSDAFPSPQLCPQCNPAGSEPKPDRLLTPEEIDAVDDAIHKEGIYYKIEDEREAWLYSHNKFNEAQDAKTAPIVYKQGYDDACKVKDAEFDKKCKECEYDPQAAEFGWFLKHGWLPPAEVKNKDAECAVVQRESEVNRAWVLSLTKQCEELEAECQERVERIFREIEKESYVEMHHPWGKDVYIDVRFIEEGKYQALKEGVK